MTKKIFSIHTKVKRISGFPFVFKFSIMDTSSDTMADHNMYELKISPLFGEMTFSNPFDRIECKFVSGLSIFERVMCYLGRFDLATYLGNGSKVSCAAEGKEFQDLFELSAKGDVIIFTHLQNPQSVVSLDVKHKSWNIGDAKAKLSDVNKFLKASLGMDLG